MTKGDISSVVSAEARTTNRDPMITAFTTRDIEYIAHNHVFVRVVRAHPIGWTN